MCRSSLKFCEEPWRGEEQVYKLGPQKRLNKSAERGGRRRGVKTTSAHRIWVPVVEECRGAERC